ncbi:hypothetical protein AAE478_003957 [Parahypoxylon ruwenzoriense]
MAEAQCVLDQVVGCNQLPRHEGRSHLAYIDAIVSETLRWRPTIGWDESVFGPGVDSFVPERWLSDSKDDTDGYARKLKNLPHLGFGFGQRMCTERHIARNGPFIIAARLLWAFNIEAAVPSDTPNEGAGRSEQQRAEAFYERLLDETASDSGLTSRPHNFKVVFRPRVPWVRELLAKHAGEDENVDLVALLDQAAAATSEKAGNA